jgi:hypothetical protein
MVTEEREITGSALRGLSATPDQICVFSKPYGVGRVTLILFQARHERKEKNENILCSGDAAGSWRIQDQAAV